MTISNKDMIFLKTDSRIPFRFDKKVASVFDDMLYRSIPCYKQVQEQIYKLIAGLPNQKKTIYDLGSSTGNLIFFLAQSLNDSSINYIGVDNSKNMIAKAKENHESKRLKGKIKFICNDILNLSFLDADVVIVNYVLQFISPETRLSFLLHLYKNLKKGAMLIVSEKTLSTDDSFSDSFTSIHEDFKLNNHYTKLEIARKRQSLENVLMPFSFCENLNLLKKSGFVKVEPFFTWFNFSSFVAIK